MQEKESVGIVKIDAFKCEKCGHIWISQKFDKNNPPIACAKCKNPYWNRPSTTETKKQELEFKEKRKLR